MVIFSLKVSRLKYKLKFMSQNRNNLKVKDQDNLNFQLHQIRPKTQINVAIFNMLNFYQFTKVSLAERYLTWPSILEVEGSISHSHNYCTEKKIFTNSPTNVNKIQWYILYKY